MPSAVRAPKNALGHSDFHQCLRRPSALLFSAACSAPCADPMWTQSGPPHMGCVKHGNTKSLHTYDLTAIAWRRHYLNTGVPRTCNARTWQIRSLAYHFSRPAPYLSPVSARPVSKYYVAQSLDLPIRSCLRMSLEPWSGLHARCPLFASAGGTTGRLRHPHNVSHFQT